MLSKKWLRLEFISISWATFWTQRNKIKLSRDGRKVLVMNRKIKQQRDESAFILEQLVTLKKRDMFTDMNERVYIGKLKNLISAFSRYLTVDGRVSALFTITFGNNRSEFWNMNANDIKTRGEEQYTSLISLLDKLRRTKRIKADIRYFSVFELQSDGNIHAHMFVSFVYIDDLCSFIEFVHDFKRRYAQVYMYKKKQALPIGRSHIGVSSMHKRILEDRYVLKPKNSKSNPDRVEYHMPELESREFIKGDWTCLEFYTKSMFEDMHSETILKYLTKTFDGETKGYECSIDSIKEGVSKSRLKHDTKTLLTDDYISQLQVAFIRLIGSRAYTHSRLPFPFKLYQKHRNVLIEYDENYKVFYNCMVDLEQGKLRIDKNNIIFANGYTIV